MAYKPITTPRGSIVVNQHGKAELTWNPSFAAVRNGNFERMQKFVDSEVLRRCSPRVPFQTGMLVGNGGRKWRGILYCSICESTILWHFRIQAV